MTGVQTCALPICAAAINEIANEDLPGCEISYVTAIRMLEAVLEDEDEAPPKRKRSTSVPEGKDGEGDETVNGLSRDDRQAVLKGIPHSFQDIFLII